MIEFNKKLINNTVYFGTDIKPYPTTTALHLQNKASDKIAKKKKNSEDMVIKQSSNIAKIETTLIEGAKLTVETQKFKWYTLGKCYNDLNLQENVKIKISDFQKALGISSIKGIKKFLTRESYNLSRLSMIITEVNKKGIAKSYEHLTFFDKIILNYNSDKDDKDRKLENSITFVLNKKFQEYLKEVGIRFMYPPEQLFTTVSNKRNNPYLFPIGLKIYGVASIRWKDTDGSGKIKFSFKEILEVFNNYGLPTYEKELERKREITKNIYEPILQTFDSLIDNNIIKKYTFIDKSINKKIETMKQIEGHSIALTAKNIFKSYYNNVDNLEIEIELNDNWVKKQKSPKKIKRKLNKNKEN